MKQVVMKKGSAFVEEIPAPQVERGCVLVAVDHSCISIGTEVSGLKGSGKPLWRRALEKPEHIKKVADMVLAHGLQKTKSLIKGKLEASSSTGYSAAGIIVAVGEGISDLKPGMRVACAGAQCAFHAEYICVPRNLTVRIPDEVTFAEASSVTLGAIAMQGVRRAAPTLGECFVVVGLGVLGQLTVQFLKANGCRVIASDVDSSRIEQAMKNGADEGLLSSEDVSKILQLTNNIGVDGVIITAAAASHSVVSTAFKMCRRKGRVVLVGDVGLHLNRADFYVKEIDFLISTSYGPGRYDPQYEEKGVDYPIGYVRWTENRNMEEYLRLIAEKKIEVASMVEAVYPLQEAGKAYDRLKNGATKPLMVLLAYDRTGDFDGEKKVVNHTIAASKQDKVRIAIAGAGGFAKGMHLPNVQSLSNLYHLQAIMSRTGHNAMNTAKQFAANYSTTDYGELVADADVDAILITTRHNLHADMVVDALQAGKHVLVEKPLALNEAELERISTFYKDSNENAPVLLTGFNRRFSEYARRAKEVLEKRKCPMVINYRMNAGYIPLDHWVHLEEGGGRNIGEACHIYDLFNYLTGSQVENIQAQSITTSSGYYSNRDNFIATISYKDGSIATLTYTALGAKEYPKEHMEVYCEGKTIQMEDYKLIRIFGDKENTYKTATNEKGQKEEIEKFAKCILQGGEWPIPLWQQVQAMEIAFEVERQIGGK